MEDFVIALGIRLGGDGLRGLRRVGAGRLFFLVLFVHLFCVAPRRLCRRLPHPCRRHLRRRRLLVDLLRVLLDLRVEGRVFLSALLVTGIRGVFL